MATFDIDTFGGSGAIDARVSEAGAPWTKTAGAATVVSGELVNTVRGTYPSQIADIEAHTARLCSFTGALHLDAEFTISYPAGSPGYGYASFGLMCDVPAEVSITSYSGSNPTLEVYVSPSVVSFDLSAVLVNGANTLNIVYDPAGTIRITINDAVVYYGAWGKSVSLPVGIYYASRSDVTAGVHTFDTRLSRIELSDGVTSGGGGSSSTWWTNLRLATVETE